MIEDDVAEVQGRDRPVVCPACGDQRVIAHMVVRMDAALHTHDGEAVAFDLLAPTSGEDEMEEWDETMPYRCGACGAQFEEFETR